MAAGTCFEARAPCDLVIVADTAGFPLLDQIHRNRATASLHLEQRWMAGIALIPDAMNPMREDGGRRSSLAALAFEGHVSIDGQGGTHKKPR